MVRLRRASQRHTCTPVWACRDAFIGLASVRFHTCGSRARSPGTRRSFIDRLDGSIEVGGSVWYVDIADWVSPSPACRRVLNAAMTSSLPEASK